MHIMDITADQKTQFVEDGYICLRGAVAAPLFRQALQEINHSLGQQGMHPDQLQTMRAQTYCPELRHSAALTALFNESAVFGAAEALIGVGRLQRVSGVQMALRFPRAGDAERTPPHGHLDGIGSGLNGSDVGDYHRGFTALAVVLLCDLPEPYSGNFTVFPGSHRTVEAHLKEHGVDILRHGCPELDWGEPLQITGQAGDVVIAHHQIIHTAAPNHSPHIRYAAISRLRHVEIDEFGDHAFTDIWHEWEGLGELAGA
jgi:hypothetical protein